MYPQQPGGPAYPPQPNQPPDSRQPYPPAAGYRQAPATPYGGNYGPELPAPGTPAPLPTQAPYAPPLPQQQYDTAPATPLPHQQYDFILKPQQSARRTMSLGGGSKAIRLLVVVLGALALIIVASIFMSVLNKPKFSTTELVTVAQEQTELLRIAGTWQQDAVSANTKNLGVNVSLGLKSDNAKLLSYLAASHVKVDATTLAFKKSAKTDAAISAAVASSTYDSVFTQIVQQQLQAYMQSLKLAYQANPGPKGQQLLNDEYSHAQLLLTQTQQP